MTMTAYFSDVIKLSTLKRCVIPSGMQTPNGRKAPAIPWTEFQHRLPTQQELLHWDESINPSLWGIVTGAVSGIVVVDADAEDSKAIFERIGLSPHVLTRRGCHYYFKHPGYPVKTCAGILPHLDIRGDGGFVNCLGANEDANYQIVKWPTDENLYQWGQLPAEVMAAMSSNGNRPAPVQRPLTEDTLPIPQGQRNDTLFRDASAMQRRGIGESAIYAALIEMNRTRCSPPLPENELQAIVKSVMRYPPAPPVVYPSSTPHPRGNYCPNNDVLASERNKSVTESVTNRDSNNINTVENATNYEERNKSVTESVTEPLAERIEKWVKETTGWFSYEEIDKEFGIHGESEKSNRRMIIKRLKEDGKIESHPTSNKLYRFINVKVRLIDFKTAGNRDPLAIRYPFGIERYFNTYPGNIIVIAGSADAGKTGFLLNFVRMNMFDFSIYYQSSEMGETELANRLEKFEGLTLDEWNFTPEERSSNFADVIRPGCVNIIDYMELSNDCYMIADYLKQIHDRLNGGIALVALQKKRGADLGRGGDFGLEKPRLYLSMDSGKLTIQKCKNWANPTISPKGLTVNFKIVGGCKFITDIDWHKDESL